MSVDQVGMWKIRLLGRSRIVTWAQSWLERNTAPGISTGLAERVQRLDELGN